MCVLRKFTPKIVDSKKIEAVDMVDKMFEQEEAKD